MIENAFPLESVLRWAASITGKGVGSDRSLLLDIIKESLEALYREESVQNIRRWCLPTCGCSITAPKEMAEPIKYKIGNKVGVIRTKAYEFQGYVRNDVEGYSSDLYYQGEFPTYFDIPSGAAHVAARALEDLHTLDRGKDGPYLVVQGLNATGNIVYARRKDGEMGVGEIVPIVGPNESPLASYNQFSKITSVEIKNSSYNVHFMWAKNVVNASTASSFGLLAYYDPGEDLPSFRRYSIPSLQNADCCYEVEVLAKLRVPELKYDNELIRGFDSGTIRNMIRANYLKSKNDIQGATFNSNLAMGAIRKDNEKRHRNGDEIPVNIATSAGKFPQIF